METGKPERGDIVVFKYPPQPSVDYIKRVIGLPGDIVRYSGDKQLCIQSQGESSCKPVKLSNVEESQFKSNGIPMIQLDEKLGNVEHNILLTHLYVTVWSNTSHVAVQLNGWYLKVSTL